jgi:osmotically-inducible protein OsmY
MNEDRLIEDRVWAALRSDRQLDSRGLSIQVVNGVVMLGGYAPTITHRDRALYTASRVPGVRNVVNQMTLN